MKTFRYIFLLVGFCIFGLPTSLFPQGTPPNENDFLAMPKTGESPLTVNFIDQTTNNTTEWHWYFEGGNPSYSDYKNPIVVYEKPGVYSVKLCYSGDNGIDSIVKKDYINVVQGKPNAEFSASLTSGIAPLKVKFEDLSANQPTSWVWHFPGGSPNISNEQNPTVLYKSEGNYTVKLLAVNSSGATEIEKVGFIKVDKQMGIGNIEFDNLPELMVYPNPAYRLLHLNYKNIEIDKIMITGIDGKTYQIKDPFKESIEGEITIDISDFPQGIYFLKINSKSETYSQKFIKL